MSIKIEISVGELLDKLTILQIKQARIKDAVKLVNVTKELNRLLELWQQSPYSTADIKAELDGLRSVNEQLWDIEDDIRMKEASSQFDDQFIQLARLVYLTNDQRARIKRSINEKFDSALVEEKSYKDY